MKQAVAAAVVAFALALEGAFILQLAATAAPSAQAPTQMVKAAGPCPAGWGKC